MSEVLQQFETITFDVVARVATITMNRPDALNPLSAEMGREMIEALEVAERDPEVRVVVVTGAGRAFGSGADLSAGGMQTPGGKPDVLTPLRTVYNPLMVKLRALEKPVIVAVNGLAVGISLSLAACGDLVIASESSYFLLAFVNIGLTIDGGVSAALPARIGFSRTSEMAVLGERVPAAQALDWGLVNRVVADDELAGAVAETAAKLAAGPPGSYAATKRLLNATAFAGFEATLDREALEQQARAESADFVEGVMAFFGKRPANFSGA